MLAYIHRFESCAQYEVSEEAYNLLIKETDAQGRQLEVIKLPCPKPLYRTQEEWEQLVSWVASSHVVFDVRCISTSPSC